MRDEQPNPAVFIEVPKPISAMSATEKALFIEQIIEALSKSTSKEERGKSRY